VPATKARPHSSGYDRRIVSLDSNGLSSKVRRLLQSRAQTRYQHGLKRGKISPKSIHRVAVGGRHAERVFRKKTENDTLDTAVSILVDCSGSMGGGPYAHAAKASIMLHEALSPLNIPLEIIGFTDHHNGPHHAIFKSFRSRTTAEDMAKAYDHFAYDMDANSDGQSIVWTYDRLMKQRNTRKVLLVLSDGQPSGYNGDAWKHTQNVIKEIEGSKSVDICAIGIMDKTVERLYTNHSVISSASELESAVLNIISNRIINH
jgi:cobalamin biosynthesis protein CobT